MHIQKTDLFKFELWHKVHGELAGDEKLAQIPEGLECSNEGFEHPSQGAGEPLKVLSREKWHQRGLLETSPSGLAPDKRISCIR